MCPDEATLKEVNEKLRQLLEGKHTPPVVNVIAITEEEFGRTAPLAQSQVGQAARHGVTPDSKGLDYRPERDPEPETVRPRSHNRRQSGQEAIFWLTLAAIHLEAFSDMEKTWLAGGSHIPTLEAQTALERAFKGLLTAGNDGTRLRRDATLMWRHIESTVPSRTRRAPSPWRVCWPRPGSRTGPDAP